MAAVERHRLGLPAGGLDALADPLGGARQRRGVAPAGGHRRDAQQLVELVARCRASAPRILPHAAVASSAMRRLFLLVAAVVLVDTMFFAAVAPLLPHYSDELGLSKSAAGVLAAAYPAGTLVGALPAGWLAARWGVKPTVLLGLGAARRHEPGLRLRQPHRAARRRPLRPGHGRRLHVGGRAGVARVGVAPGPARRADRLGAGAPRSSACCSVRCSAARPPCSAPRSCSAAWRCSPPGSRPGPGRCPACRPEPSAGMPALAARPAPAAVLVGFWLFTLPASSPGVARGARPAAAGRAGRQRRRHRRDLPGRGGGGGGAQPAGRAALRPPRAPGADPRRAGRRGRDGGAAAAAGDRRADGVPRCWSRSPRSGRSGRRRWRCCRTPPRRPGSTRRSRSRSANLAWALGHMVGGGGGGALADATADALPTGCSESACALRWPLLALGAARPRARRRRAD